MPLKQSGIALPISLILLAVMTIIAISTLRGSNNAERIVSSQQHKMITFEATESTVLAAWKPDFITDAIKERLSNGDSIDDAFGVTLDDGDFETDFDQTSALGEIDISGDLTVQYCGDSSLIGGGLDSNEAANSPVAMLVEVKSTLRIDNTKSKSVVVRRGKLPSLEIGIPGSCTSY